MRSFVARYGWRAWALPVLAVVTVAALVHDAAGRSSPPPRAAAGSVAPVAPLQSQQPAPPAPVTVRTAVDTSTPCEGNTYKQLALVSIKAQRVWMCALQRQIYTTAVTTGSKTDDDQTPLGSWRVQARQRDRYLVGPGYRDYVHYWVPFNGDFGFHDATWQTMPFGSPDWVTKGSHGCVHMPMPAMRWFYGWAQVSDTVVTIAA